MVSRPRSPMRGIRGDGSDGSAGVRAPEVRGPGPTRPGPSGPRPTRPGPPRPRATVPDDVGPRPAGPGASRPRATVPLHRSPGPTGPVTAGPGAAVPRATRPRAAVPGGVGPAAAVPRLPEDVLLAAEHGPVVWIDDVHAAPGELERAETGAEGEGLRRDGGDPRARRLVDVEHAGALQSRAGVAERLGGRGEEPLDLVRRERGSLLQEQGHRAGHNGCGLRGAAAPEEAALPVSPGRAVDGTGVGLVQEGAGVAQAGERATGSDEVRRAGRVPAVREARDLVVVGLVGAVVVLAADRDDEGVHRGVVECGGVVAVVAGRDDHHDALAPRDLGGVGERVEQVALL